MDQRVPAWEMAFVSGPPGAERDDAIRECLGGGELPMVTATEDDHPLLPYPGYPAGPGHLLIAGLAEESEEGYRAIERLLLAGVRVLVVTRDPCYRLWPRFAAYRMISISPVPEPAYSDYDDADFDYDDDDDWLLPGSAAAAIDDDLMALPREGGSAPQGTGALPGGPLDDEDDDDWWMVGPPTAQDGGGRTAPSADDDGWSTASPPPQAQPVGTGPPPAEPVGTGPPSQEQPVRVGSAPQGRPFGRPGDADVGWETPADMRTVSIAVVDGGGRAATGGVPAELPYLVRVGIGRPRFESILAAEPPDFPVRLLPRSSEGWWLTAVLSRDGVHVASGTLFLPRTGEGFSCSCTPNGPHGCTESDRSPWVSLAAVAPRGGVERLQLALHFGAATVQAFEIDVPVGGDTPPAARAVLTLSVDLAELTRFGDRTVSIRFGDLPAGRHYLVVNDRAGTKVGTSISDHQAGNAARSLRSVLFDRQLARADGGWTSLYDDRLAKPRDAYLDDLRELARAGATAYLGLFPRVDDRDAMAAALKLADGPGVIQVALAEGSSAVVPWQLVYGLPIVDDAAVCPSALEFGPGSTGVAVPDRCPHGAGHDQARGILCPFGFWGLGHVLEVPPSSGTMTLAEATGTDRPPAVVVGLHESLRGTDWDAQLAALDRLGTGSVVTTTVAALEDEIRHGADLLYLFCHGRRVPGRGTASGAVALDFGPGGTLTAEEVCRWAEVGDRMRWQRRRPLVVLNGCHTGERLPETLIDFVGAFVQSPGAAGVLATEVTMEQRLAAYSMSAFVTAWGEGHGVGEALRRMRWQLLARGNVMGLAYSPYCDADLRLP